MARILSFTNGPKDWQALLADPDKHWKKGYSACTLAHCWEAADGLPPEITLAFRQSNESLLTDLTAIVAVPEFKVHLPGGVAASQSDVFVLAKSSVGPVCIMVEGKVNEPFGERLGEWREGASPGKERRLRFLLRELAVSETPPDRIRYQLLHRAASAMITGKQYRAAASVLLIHSFSHEHVGFNDYREFARLFRVDARIGSVQRLTNTSPPLFGGWVEGDCAFLKCEG